MMTHVWQSDRPFGPAVVAAALVRFGGGDQDPDTAPTVPEPSAPEPGQEEPAPAEPSPAPEPAPEKAGAPAG
jgi:hypothetical protein